jgi:hypothetical protein
LEAASTGVDKHIIANFTKKVNASMLCEEGSSELPMAAVHIILCSIVYRTKIEHDGMVIKTKLCTHINAQAIQKTKYIVR